MRFFVHGLIIFHKLKVWSILRIWRYLLMKEEMYLCSVAVDVATSGSSSKWGFVCWFGDFHSTKFWTLSSSVYPVFLPFFKFFFTISFFLNHMGDIEAGRMEDTWRHNRLQKQLKQLGKRASDEKFGPDKCKTNWEKVAEILNKSIGTSCNTKWIFLDFIFLILF